MCGACAGAQHALALDPEQAEARYIAFLCTAYEDDAAAQQHVARLFPLKGTSVRPFCDALLYEASRQLRAEFEAAAELETKRFGEGGQVAISAGRGWFLMKEYGRALDSFRKVAAGEAADRLGQKELEGGLSIALWQLGKRDETVAVYLESWGESRIESNEPDNLAQSITEDWPVHMPWTEDELKCLAEVRAALPERKDK